MKGRGGDTDSSILCYTFLLCDINYNVWYPTVEATFYCKNYPYIFSLSQAIVVEKNSTEYLVQYVLLMSVCTRDISKVRSHCSQNWFKKKSAPKQGLLDSLQYFLPFYIITLLIEAIAKLIY